VVLCIWLDVLNVIQNMDARTTQQQLQPDNVHGVVGQNIVIPYNLWHLFVRYMMKTQNTNSDEMMWNIKLMLFEISEYMDHNTDPSEFARRMKSHIGEFVASSLSILKKNMLDPNNSIHQIIMEHLKENDKIGAIKIIRTYVHNQMGLKESKDFIEGPLRDGISNNGSSKSTKRATQDIYNSILTADALEMHAEDAELQATGASMADISTMISIFEEIRREVGDSPNNEDPEEGD